MTPQKIPGGELSSMSLLHAKLALLIECSGTQMAIVSVFSEHIVIGHHFNRALLPEEAIRIWSSS